MNCLLYSVNEIQNQIPHELLYAGFTIDDTPETVNLTSLDDKIVRKLLKKRVLVDANIVGGIETLIPLNKIPPTHYEYNYTVYQIPPELTMNKEIISALSLAMLYGNGVFGTYNTSQGNFDTLAYSNSMSLTNVANRIGNSVSTTGMINNAHLEIIGYNTVLIYANYRLLSNYTLRVILENDSNLNNISPRSYKDFSLMCVLGTKAYLYNKLIVPVNSGYLMSGQDLGVFKSILESYSDAEEQYRTYIHERVGALMYMNDTTRYSKLLQSMLAPDL